MVEVVGEIILEKLFEKDRLYFGIHINATLLTVESLELCVDNGLISFLTHKISIFNMNFTVQTDKSPNTHQIPNISPKSLN